MYIFVREFALDLMETSRNICSVILQGVGDSAKSCVEAQQIRGDLLQWLREAKALSFCYGLDKLCRADSAMNFCGSFPGLNASINQIA